MRVKRAVVLLGLSSCAAHDLADPPPAETIACESRKWAQPSEPAPELDLVVAIGDVPPDVLAAGMEQLGAYVAAYQTSVHIAVLADDPGEVGDYLVDLDEPWFLCPGEDCRTRNYEGALAEALIERAVPSTGPVPLLARIDHALANDHGFVAPDGYLGVLVISASDDASPETPLTYANRIRARVPDLHAWFTGVTRPGDRRLAAFLYSDPWPVVSSIDDPDWRAAMPWGEFWQYPIPAACLAENADPTQCTAMDGDTPVPRCLMAAPDRPDPATPLPCYWIKDDPNVCGGFGLSLEPIVEFARWQPIDRFFDTSIICACQ